MAGMAMAQVTPELESVIAEQKDKVKAIVLQQQRGLADGCGKIAVLMPSTVSVFEPLQMADGKPVKGRWNVRYAVDACGMAQLRNIAMEVVPTGVALEVLVPGDSLADKNLQADVEKSFTMAGRVAMPKCTEQAVIREAKVRVFPHTPKDAWVELWIGRMCGRDLGQIVTFVPNENGTAFRMSLPKASAEK